MIEVKKYALRQSKDGTIISFVLHPHDDSTELVTAPIGAVFEISYGLITDNVRDDGVGERIRTRAVLLCKDERFQRWIVGTERNEATEEDAVYLLRHECDVFSRSELATDVEAQKRFLELERRYREEMGQVAEQRG